MLGQPEKILEAYQLTILGITRGRGCYICQTEQGIKVLQPFGGQEARAKKLAELLVFLKENNPAMEIEQILPNREGSFLTMDEEGNRFLLKDRIPGTEHSLLDAEGKWNRMESRNGIRSLATLHNSFSCYKEWNSRLDYGEFYGKRVRLLVKVRNYMKGRKKRNEFERIYLEHSEGYLRQARQAASEAAVLLPAQDEAGICHGELNHHNLFVSGEGVAVVNFESVKDGWMVTDLVNYLRKLMEKTCYDFSIARELVEEYERVRVLSGDEKKMIYYQFLFPEKFYKLSIHYDNSKKNLVSGREMEKLTELVEREEERKAFLTKLFSFTCE